MWQELRFRISGWLGPLTWLALGAGLFLAMCIYGYAAKPGWVGVADKTVWDWMELLIVPVVLGGGGFYFTTRLQNMREQQIEEMRRATDREIAERQSEDAALQDYLQQITQLATDNKLFDTKSGDPMRILMQTHTLVVLEKLSGTRKRTVLQLLYDLNLIAREAEQPTVTLNGADLSYANLHGTTMLRGARLSGADMSGADLRDADLRDANLSRANLKNVDMSGADLRGADLTVAVVRNTEDGLERLEFLSTIEQLEQYVASLEGATMPNGQKFEDWLKDREDRKEDTENE
jgi:hypothetical protein